MVREPVTNAQQDIEAYPDPNTPISTFRTSKPVVLGLVGLVLTNETVSITFTPTRTVEAILLI